MRFHFRPIEANDAATARSASRWTRCAELRGFRRQPRPQRRSASTRTCVGCGIGAGRPVNIKAALTFPLLVISSTLNCTTSSQQQMLLHCQMAYKAHSAALILSVASIKNWIEADKIRLCLQDLKNLKASLELRRNLLFLPVSIKPPDRCQIHFTDMFHYFRLFSS